MRNLIEIAMHLTVTCVATDETVMALNRFSNTIETAINPSLAQVSYGTIGRFMLVIVSVEEDAEENLRFCEKHNKSGAYTHPFTKEKVKYFSLAVPFNPKEIVSLAEDNLRKRLISEMIEVMAKPAVKVPKGFDYDGLAKKLTLDLQILGAATFETITR